MQLVAQRGLSLFQPPGGFLMLAKVRQVAQQSSLVLLRLAGFQVVAQQPEGQICIIAIEIPAFFHRASP